ncbi:hypothetical protein BpHYR1_054068 [Brachionus plicatilis]|uniref:Uncharacterized protein n=1 Tax=Brachionus plicatilis TaxID=10195 RepID=A0A3M7RCY0_BRAPC|nr:hypothetical protein BpHYR1_054068 [Brachionus plicatilis]
MNQLLEFTEHVLVLQNLSFDKLKIKFFAMAFEEILGRPFLGKIFVHFVFENHNTMLKINRRIIVNLINECINLNFRHHSLIFKCEESVLKMRDLGVTAVQNKSTLTPNGV